MRWNKGWSKCSNWVIFHAVTYVIPVWMRVSLSSWSNEANPIKGITLDIFLLLLLLFILFLEVALSGQSISYTWRPKRMLSLAIFILLLLLVLRVCLSSSSPLTLVPLLPPHPAHSGLKMCVGASDVSLIHLHQCIQLPTLSLSHPSLSPSSFTRFVFLLLLFPLFTFINETSNSYCLARESDEHPSYNSLSLSLSLSLSGLIIRTRLLVKVTIAWQLFTAM